MTFKMPRLWKASFEDVLRICELEDELEAHLASYAGKKPDMHEIQASVHSALKDPARQIVLGGSDSQIHGYVRTRQHSPTLYVDRLYVRPEARGNRLGAALLATVENMAAAAGCAFSRLDVVENDSKAIDFYKAWDYVKLGTAVGLVQMRKSLR